MKVHNLTDALRADPGVHIERPADTEERPASWRGLGVGVEAGVFIHPGIAASMKAPLPFFL